ncbi:hypothetical protein HAX54_003131 [Datura stramonium]|uniref:Uncharacterized protein n=1 Tax=Datura stramonium TaxID=4076 RepID=A0ABS8WRX8_DATST|nr:hypothetical protein [Datura stramonium]
MKQGADQIRIPSMPIFYVWWLAGDGETDEAGVVSAVAVQGWQDVNGYGDEEDRLGSGAPVGVVMGEEKEGEATMVFTERRATLTGGFTGINGGCGSHGLMVFERE